MLVTSWDDGTVLYANPAAVKCFDTGVGRTATEFYCDPGRRVAMVEELSKHGCVSGFELLLNGISGQLHSALVSAAPIEFEGQPAIYCVLSDISHQKQLEQALRQSESHYRLLAENSMDVIWQTDIQLRLVYVSPSINSMMGLDPGTLMNKALPDLLSTASNAYFSRLMLSRIEEEAAGTRFKGQLLELEFAKEGGASLWCEVTINAIRDQLGNLTGFQGVTRDISERIRFEDRLKRSEKGYRELVEQSNSIILRWSTDGIITFANNYACEFFGFLPEELVGRHLLGSIVPEIESSSRNLRSLIEDISAAPEQFRITDHENILWDGSRVWIAWANSPSYDHNGNIVEILSVGHDITERIQRERQLSYLTVYDAMTGLYNRPFFEAELDRLARGRNFPVSIVIISLDNLMEINEQEGRDDGDLLLMKTTRVLKEAFRCEDLISRSGGEGFAILLPGLDEHMVTSMLVRFRNAVAKASEEHPAIVLSIGAATAKNGDELPRAQRQAALAMSQEKIRNRNKNNQKSGDSEEQA
jgi:diguanylate cyclase (GGDEF)-like protein/PAS domain S-box-containing protein